MQGTIAITDFDWYQTLLASAPNDEVNFWLPSARRGFRSEPYSPFFFKLRHPHNAIVGFGLFERYVKLPDWLAWECFEARNGCVSFAAMRERIERIRKGFGYQKEGGSNEIGCVLIAQPVFFPEEQWIPQPADWKPRTQRAAKYDLAVGEGLRVWLECQERLKVSDHQHILLGDEQSNPLDELFTRAKVRPGQGTFRVQVSEAYDWACSVSREHSLPALEAAHIRPVSDDGPTVVSNGLLLRADLHRLFDRGYVTVTPRHRLEVSPRLKQDFSIGRSYYPLSGRELNLPSTPGLKPSPEFLKWHNEHCYLG